MTLVLSCLTHQFVVQVSDCRVSRIRNDQLEIVDDHRNKGTLYCSEMAFAYSGLAELGQEHTDVWMMNVLALAVSLNDTAHLLRRKATEEFRRIRRPSAFKRHAFVGVGWGKPSENSPIIPVRVTISNACSDPLELDNYDSSSKISPRKGKHNAKASNVYTQVQSPGGTRRVDRGQGQGRNLS